VAMRSDIDQVVEPPLDDVLGTIASRHRVWICKCNVLFFNKTIPFFS
jgi:hypothetical protein